jgi:hypothetical protein
MKKIRTNKFNTLMLFVVISHSVLADETFKELPKEEELVLCQDQAENFGNGKGGNSISQKCIDSYIVMAPSLAIKESKETNIKVYGYRNMILIKKKSPTSIVTQVIAGTSTELNGIEALAIDEKNQEIAVLEENGDVLFFSSRITGNVSPYRILRHKDLEGAVELVVDNRRDQIIVYNKKNKKILFFSRLANVNGRKENQRLGIIKTIDTSMLDFKNLTIDLQQSQLSGLDEIEKKNVTYHLSN